jgi:hypothetical protein
MPAFTKEGAHAGPVEDWTLYRRERLNRYLRDEGVIQRFLRKEPD